MKVRYANHQDKSDLMNGVEIAEVGKLVELLNARRKRPPFLARLSGDNGFELMLGIGSNVGCVQHSPSDGSPPYLLAMSAKPPMKNGGVEFLTANTPTPFTARHILRFTELEKVACHFLGTGERSNEVLWERVGAVRPDVHGPWHPRPYQIVLRFLLERWHNHRDDANAKIALGVPTRSDWQPGRPVKLCYLNHQDTHDPLNGRVLGAKDDVAALLAGRRNYSPFVAQFLADNGFKLVFGIGSGVGFVQFRRIDGDLPYYMARSSRQPVKRTPVAFRVDNVPVGIPGRYILNFDEVEWISQHFLATGDRDPAFKWGPI
jgi:hypothetical protein